MTCYIFLWFCQVFSSVSSWLKVKRMLYIICFKAFRDNWSLLNFIFQDHGTHFLTLICPEMTNMYKLHKLLVLLDIPKVKIPSDTIEKKNFLPRNNSLSPVLVKQSCRPLVPYGWWDSLRFGTKESCFVHHNRQCDSFKAIILHFCELQADSYNLF